MDRTAVGGDYLLIDLFLCVLRFFFYLALILTISVSVFIPPHFMKVLNKNNIMLSIDIH